MHCANLQSVFAFVFVYLSSLSSAHVAPHLPIRNLIGLLYPGIVMMMMTNFIQFYQKAEQHWPYGIIGIYAYIYHSFVSQEDA